MSPDVKDVNGQRSELARESFGSSFGGKIPVAQREASPWRPAYLWDARKNHVTRRGPGLRAVVQVAGVARAAWAGCEHLMSSHINLRQS